MMDLSQDSLFDLQGIDFLWCYVYSGVECVCGVTLSVLYLHWASYTRRGQADFSACPVWIYVHSE